MELYHVLNRGVDKRNIFLDEKDRVRFVHDLYEFNTDKPVTNTQYRFKKNMGLRNPYIRRVAIVDIHGWCLMGNHYHLLLSERMEGGLTKFIRKLNVGYANYFNEKYDRSGSLFQGRTKKVHIDTDAHFLHMLHYVHLNPLDYIAGAEYWRERKVQQSAHAIQFLTKYRWSSYQDYCGKNNFPSILTKELFTESLGDIEEATKKYLEYITIDELGKYLLE